MELILWRHAEAEDGPPDIERKLTAKGHKQARRMAKWLKARVPAGIRVFASPARRAIETAQALEMDYETVPEIAPECPPEALLAAIKWPRPLHNLLLVGHQPTLGAAAALLMSGRTDSWSIKKGGIIWLARRDAAGQTRLQLRAVMSPDLIEG